MSNYIINNLNNLSNEDLIYIVKDCESRIGSHVAGGMVNEEYVNSQREIISAVQDEFLRRG